MLTRIGIMNVFAAILIDLPAQKTGKSIQLLSSKLAFFITFIYKTLFENLGTVFITAKLISNVLTEERKLIHLKLAREEYNILRTMKIFLTRSPVTKHEFIVMIQRKNLSSQWKLSILVHVVHNEYALQSHKISLILFS